MKIKLITDSACDLPLAYVKENNIDVLSLSVNIKGQFVNDDLGQTLKYDEFYALLRSGEMTSTAQINVFTFEEKFREYVQEGYSIIYIGLSAPLSGTVNSARIARENLLEEYPQCDINVIDSKSVSLGEGALVYYACEMLKEGKSKDEIINWVNNNATKVIHSIVVDDLNHLKRGGRISGATAAIGGILGIKPTIKIDDEGKIFPGAKIKGRKKALKFIVDEIREKGVNLQDQMIFICHADCLDEAEQLKELILSQIKVKGVMINQIGAVIGTHGGPGTLAGICIGQGRN